MARFAIPGVPVVLIAVGALAWGCGLDWVMPPDEGEGGSGAEDPRGGAGNLGHGGAGATTSATATSTAMSGAGGMPVSCPQDDCVVCSTCASQGPCAGEFATCDANPACVDLWNCFYQCDVSDAGCIDACHASHPAGANDFDAELGCYCVYCFNVCADCQL